MTKLYLTSTCMRATRKGVIVNLRSCLLCLLLLAAPSVTMAQATDVSLADVQYALKSHMELIGRPDVVQKLEQLEEEAWQVLYDAMPAKGQYLDAVATLQSPDPAARTASPSTTAAAGVAGAAASSFPPAYPSGADYNAYRATLPGLGLLFDSPDVGTESGNSLENERCDANGEGGLRIATHALIFATIAADATCAGVGTFSCIAYGVAAAASYASEVALSQCGYQTALVDSAEIEAAFENTVAIIGTVNDIDAITSNELNFTSDAELAVLHNQLTTHDTDIKAALDVHDDNLTQHHTDITNQLSTHDADVKALLVNLQGSVDLMLERQLEVIRLLHTPEGRRTSDVPACGGAGCSFPDR